jgi:hypothetical protein
MDKKQILIEYIIQDIVAFIVSDKKIEYDEAMKLFYSSKIFEKLQDSKTGLYLESSAYIYEIFKDELSHGKIFQREV